MPLLLQPLDYEGAMKERVRGRESERQRGEKARDKEDGRGVRGREWEGRGSLENADGNTHRERERGKHKRGERERKER